MPKAEDRQRLTIRLPRAVARDFKARAASRGETMQEVVERWIARYLDRSVEKKK